MKPFKTFLIPLVCLVTSVGILYARTMLINNLSGQRQNSSTMTRQTKDAITIHYHERPPYYITGILDVYGLCCDPAKLAFKKAGVAFKWEKTPASRQLDIIRRNKSRACSIGWFKNPEREKFARFSLFLYRDKPAIALARADNMKIISQRPLKQILADPDLTLLKKKDYSYGRFVDEQIKKFSPRQEITSSGNKGMLKMIYAKRADYFFVSREEAQSLTSRTGLSENAFKMVEFSDMPQGNKRYLIFSKNVNKKLIQKINQAIGTYVHETL